MDALSFCHWMEQTAVGAGIRESLWLFPAIETLHLVGMIVLVGTAAAFDLRLLGWAMRERSIADVGGQLLPWSWAGFAVQVVTGGLLFSSEAVKCYGNLAFRVKMVLLLLAGVNALIFHKNANSRREVNGAASMGAKVAGCFSLLLWLGVVTAGRFIGFV